MQTKTFDVFWYKAILPYCQTFFAEIPDEIKQKYRVELNTSDSLKIKLRNTYDWYRELLHQNYFKSRPNALIDRHKISSCIIAAITKCRPISFLMYETPPVSLILSNYKIAFFSGVKSLYLLRIAQWINDDNMTDLISALYEQKMFKFPKTQEGHDEYSLGCVKSIALTDLRGYPFDILAYSNILYWIERFNDENIFRLINQSNE